MNAESSYQSELEASLVRCAVPREITEAFRAFVTEKGVENISLFPLFVDDATYRSLKMIQERRRAMGGFQNPEAPDSVAAFFSNFYQDILDRGFDGTVSDMLIRWVAAPTPEELATVSESASKNGGKIDDKVGLNMSQLGSKADNYVAASLQGNQSGVLFLYDGRKLRKLTTDESAQDINFAGGYGYTTIGDENYASSLLGLIEIY